MSMESKRKGFNQIVKGKKNRYLPGIQRKEKKNYNW